ncbi:DUF551 domain-containing protein [Acetobacter oeni]|uniref:DUF551 domain-containing protein n=2 Tax=Acetobacter oeni TaxID=304077 RepID=A0A511XKU4_9PROT|nr:hypothetical protein [Acetobacter oeni]GEN63565.1 hypothetical protein AOE01nite_17890 [Acetobacter oeni]
MSETTSEMIEAAARVLCENQGFAPDGDDSECQSEMGVNWRAFEFDAKQAIGAANSVSPSPWQKIEAVPSGDEIFLAATIDGRVMVVRGNILQNMMRKDTPAHLQFPATHWMPLPAAPKVNDE